MFSQIVKVNARLAFKGRSESVNGIRRKQIKFFHDSRGCNVADVI